MLDNEELKNDFDFIPHDFGPWSEALKDTIDRMEIYGLVKKIPNRKPLYLLTNEGKALATRICKSNPSFLEIARIVIEDFSELSDDDLIGAVYELYPEYTTDSLIKNKTKKCSHSDFLVVSTSLNKNKTPIEIKSRCGKRFIVEFKDSNIILREM